MWSPPMTVNSAGPQVVYDNRLARSLQVSVLIQASTSAVDVNFDGTVHRVAVNEEIIYTDEVGPGGQITVDSGGQTCGVSISIG